MASHVQRIETDEWTIRDLYRKAGIEARYKRGELSLGIRRSRPAPPSAGQPKGTLSETVEFKNRWGMLICIAHPYMRPDGSLGASGKRDPKYLRMGATVYIVPAAKKHF